MNATVPLSMLLTGHLQLVEPVIDSLLGGFV